MCVRMCPTNCVNVLLCAWRCAYVGRVGSGNRSCAERASEHVHACSTCCTAKPAKTAQWRSATPQRDLTNTHTHEAGRTFYRQTFLVCINASRLAPPTTTKSIFSPSGGELSGGFCFFFFLLHKEHLSSGRHSPPPAFMSPLFHYLLPAIQ